MSYYLYWGKAKPSGEDGCCHLLPYHSLDVAAVGWHLLAPERPLTRLLAARLDLSPDVLRCFFVFLLGLHDLGKFSRSFQGLARPEGVQLVSSVERYEYTARHDRLGALLWQECWFSWLEDGTLRWPAVSLERPQRRQRRQAMQALLAPFFGHHGQPVEAEQLRLEQFFATDNHSNDLGVARQFVEEWAALIDVEWPVESLVSAEWLQAFRSLSWTMAGWATLSDWLGSNQEHFHYCQKVMPLAEYWGRHALPRAEAALRDTGFDRLPKPLAYSGLDRWFDDGPVTPTPLQREAETLPISPGPQLFILEDITGAGKTEAACILAQRLLADGHAEGLYFALPTMATSNAMYERLGLLASPLLHGRLHPSFVWLMVPAG
jgi:CRISPR-associated endonuclease/helicase Cas3